MEGRLKALLSDDEADRIKLALEWKKQGKKVIGVLCTYIPEEVISAAGMLPWRVRGTYRAAVPLAMTHRVENTCVFCAHVLESALNGELDFLDGVVATDWDQDLLRMWDVWASLGKPPFSYMMHIPRTPTKLGCQEMAREITKFRRALEQSAEVRITDEALRQSIQEHNEMRTLLMNTYELRKRETPPISGAEALGITLSAMTMPKAQFNAELKILFPYLEKRKAPLKQVSPRLLVSGDRLDSRAHLDLVEGEGCLVAMDDLEIGSRYFWHTVDSDHDNLVDALAKRYILDRPACPRMFFWDRGFDQTIKWVRDFHIDGVLELKLRGSRPREYRGFFMSESLKEAGISCIDLTREYELSSVGQLKTRIGAFLEMLEGKA